MRSWSWKGLLSKYVRPKNPSQQRYRIVCETCKKIQKAKKCKFIGSRWMQDINKWFGKWDDLFVCEVFLLHQLIQLGNMWDSHFTHYVAYVAPNYKSISFSNHWNHTPWCMLKLIQVSIICPIISMRLLNVRWGFRAHTRTLVDCEHHTSIQYYIWLWPYATLLNTHYQFISLSTCTPFTTTMCTLNCNVHC